MSQVLSTVATQHTLGEYAKHGEQIQATSQPQQLPSAQRHIVVVRSFAGVPADVSSRPAGRVRTAVSEAAPLVIAPKRAGDDVIRDLSGFRNMLTGWDGEDACAPSQDSITEAVRFVHAATTVTGLAERFIATLHANGIAILELNDEIDASLEFVGDGTIIYAIDGMDPGIAKFDGRSIPSVIKNAICPN